MENLLEKNQNVVKENKLVKELKKVKSVEQNEIDGDIILQNSKTLLLGAGDQDKEVLKALGLDHIHKYQDQLTADIIRTKMAEDIYAKDAFTGKQIRALCNTYYLKCLPVDLYNGNITAELPRIVAAFAEKHNIDLKEQGMSNFFILAPMEMFKTEKIVHPKPIVMRDPDPMLLYRPVEKGTSTHNTHRKVTEGCILAQVHNWGSDFSELRRFKILFNTTTETASDWSPLGFTVLSALFLLGALVVAFLGAPLISLILGIVALFFALIASADNHYIDRLWNEPKV